MEKFDFPLAREKLLFQDFLVFRSAHGTASKEKKTFYIWIIINFSCFSRASNAVFVTNYTAVFPLRIFFGKR